MSQRHLAGRTPGSEVRSGGGGLGGAVQGSCAESRGWCPNSLGHLGSQVSSAAELRQAGS